MMFNYSIGRASITASRKSAASIKSSGKALCQALCVVSLHNIDGFTGNSKAKFHNAFHARQNCCNAAPK
jgi:hypothetical protein